MSALGVKPMNCPGCLFRRSIDIRRENRHDQKLADSNFVSLTLKLAPSCAFCAINANRLRSSTFTRARVPFGFWIIACISGHEAPKERIFQGLCEKRTWHDDDALPLEAFVFLAPFHSAKNKKSPREAVISSLRERITGFACVLIVEKLPYSSQQEH